MFKLNNFKLQISVLLLVITLIQCASLNENIENAEDALEEADKDRLELKKAKLIFKILRTYLVNELDRLDQLYAEKIESMSNDEETITDRRELKRQGILERIKNKMEHDLSKYGWD